MQVLREKGFRKKLYEQERARKNAAGLDLPCLPYPLLLERMASLNDRNFASERRFARALRATNLNFVFFRNYPLLNYYFGDFVDVAQKIVIEVDGPHHAEAGQTEYDLLRDENLKKMGYKVFRTSAGEIASWRGTIEALEPHQRRAKAAKDLPWNRKKPKQAINLPKHKVPLLEAIMTVSDGLLKYHKMREVGLILEENTDADSFNRAWSLYLALKAPKGKPA